MRMRKCSAGGEFKNQHSTVLSALRKKSSKSPDEFASSVMTPIVYTGRCTRRYKTDAAVCTLLVRLSVTRTGEYGKHRSRSVRGSERRDALSEECFFLKPPWIDVIGVSLSSTPLSGSR